MAPFSKLFIRNSKFEIHREKRGGLYPPATRHPPPATRHAPTPVQCPHFGGNPLMKNFNLDAILEAMLKISDRVSDLNFSVGRPPQVEVDGQLVAVNFPGLPRLTPYQTEMIALH